jgi:hypothetical protein
MQWIMHPLKLLLENNANVHADNDRALQCASKFETIKLLLENNANVHVNNNNILQWTHQYNKPKIVKLLLAYGANEAPINYELLDSNNINTLENYDSII